MATDPQVHGRPLLDATGLSARLTEHVGRIRRSGGFLSVAALRFIGPSGSDTNAAAAAYIRLHMRGQDLLGEDPKSDLLLVLPDTDTKQARRAAERLMTEALASVPGAAGAAGVATAFGQVEGGGEALIDAAAQALATATPGQIVASDAVSGRPRVLVVDDDEVFAQVLADTITELGWAGEPCSEPVDAAQRIREGGYYGLFVDLVLPGSSGVLLLKQFLADHRSRPAILMSGQDASTTAVVEALSLGPVMFLGKPPSTHDVESVLNLFRQMLPGGPR